MTVQDRILNAREYRFKIQRMLIEKYKLPLLCFTMNIAGEKKSSPLIELAFDEGIKHVENTFPNIVYCKKRYCDTGPEAYFVLNASATEIKKQTCIIEESGPVGRLFDLDVINASGEKLSREKNRACIICGGPVYLCSRNRSHGLENILIRTNEILMDFASSYMADAAILALKYEVHLTPKPGLVDMKNNGAHRDMDLGLFCKSADSLRSYFVKAVNLGFKSSNCMHELQREGLEAEKNMFAVTNGVNTHKGAIYGLGLLLAAMGSCLVRQDKLFFRASELAKRGMPSAYTNGSAMVARYGVRGARQEAELGFPSVQFALESLGKNNSDALMTLMEIIIECQDTNLLFRGGEEGLQLARVWAARIIEAPPDSREQLLIKMDEEFIKRNLSPGGSADILAQAIFLKSLGDRLLINVS